MCIYISIHTYKHTCLLQVNTRIRNNVYSKVIAGVHKILENLW